MLNILLIEIGSATNIIKKGLKEARQILLKKDLKKINKKLIILNIITIVNNNNNMNFSKHEIKVYNNSELILYQQVHLELLVCELTEIKSLLDLFYKNETKAKLKSKQTLYEKYEKKLTEKINNSKRLLKNTKIRLSNNISKCMS